MGGGSELEPTNTRNVTGTAHAASPRFVVVPKRN